MTDTAGTEKLQKVLARAGMGSRRQMEALIRDGRVRVDGRAATLGDRVSPHARITVDGRPLGRTAVEPPPRQVLIYHKPAGEVTTRSDPEGRPTVFKRLPQLRRGRWVVVGRLDVNTSGLLLFTTDGELANRLMHPRYRLPRDYAVRVFGGVGDDVIARLTEGVTLEDGPARFESVEPLSPEEAANEWFRVRLREGRRREVRRLWESQGLQVSRLIRVQFGPVELPPRLRQGQHATLKPGEVRQLYELVGLPVADTAERRRPRTGRGGGGRRQGRR
ncbi:Ribosomal large subunit pseudouridine synthase B [wastewater metagenome]|uniref:Ribosomal large subunit pseudouridine synthase B n=2 Tax=unclassified sequences TaxID=12908 RepID=A0A5B8R7Z8_9ZZZZ|nr:pseudouridine synthase [Arhodomonas aquaeolei]MCS4505022.1 pseudouridine synthase [Arhodomonas aquaeolei]QEA05249.1 ribosomal large subunit pseudouridine synthase B [uncultured organism]